MGAKQKITQAPTMTPEQLALLNSMMRGVTNQMQGFTLGQTWGGPGTSSRAGFGGKAWDTGGTPSVNPWFQAIANTRPRGAVGMPQAPIPGAPVGPAGMNPGQAPNPFMLAAYSDRNQLVSPIVNPFRRNLGG